MLDPARTEVSSFFYTGICLLFDLLSSPRLHILPVDPVPLVLQGLLPPLHLAHHLTPSPAIKKFRNLKRSDFLAVCGLDTPGWA